MWRTHERRRGADPQSENLEQRVLGHLFTGDADY